MVAVEGTHPAAALLTDLAVVGLFMALVVAPLTVRVALLMVRAVDPTRITVIRVATATGTG